MKLFKTLKQIPKVPLKGQIIILTYYLKKMFGIEVNKTEFNFKKLILCLDKGHGKLESITNDTYKGTIQFESKPINFILRNYKYSDMGILHEFICQNEYLDLFKLLKNTHTSEKALSVIDAGGNIGLFSIATMGYFPNSNIAYIEPDKEGIEHFKKMLTINKLPIPHIFNYGLSNESDAHIHLQQGPRGPENAGFVITKSNDPTGLQTININDVITQIGVNEIDVLKMDIEGSEEEVILGNNFSIELANKIGIIAIEIHDDQVNRSAIETKLLSVGFKKLNANRVDIFINSNKQYANIHL